MALGVEQVDNEVAELLRTEAGLQKASLPRETEEELDELVANVVLPPQASLPLPSLSPPANEEEPHEASFEEKREQLHDFFRKRVRIDRIWTFVMKMPRKGRDKDFDKLLEELALSDNRAYASRRWKIFKDDNGISPPPSYESSEKELLRHFQHRINQYTYGDASDKLAIVNEAISLWREMEGSDNAHLIEIDSLKSVYVDILDTLTANFGISFGPSVTL